MDTGSDAKGPGACFCGRPHATATLSTVLVRGRLYYWMTGDIKDPDTDLKSDGVALKEGYVSVTPLQLQMTNMDFTHELNEWSFD